MKRFKKFRDDRFALTTLQNPLCEASPAELAQAAEHERQRHRQPAAIPATPSSSTPNPPAAPDAPAAANPSPAPDPQAAAPAPPNSQNETAQLPEQQEQSYEYAMIVPVESPLASENTQRPPRKPRKIAKSRRKRKKRGKSDDLSAVASRLAGYMERAEKLASLGGHSSAMQALQPVAPAIARPAPSPVPAPDAAEDPEEESDEEFDEELDEVLSDVELAKLSAADRHSRKCSVCHHPQRQEIEEYFVEWHSPTTIVDCFGVKSFTSLYHHAHALGLFELRARNLRGALANMIEDSDRTEATPKEVIQAVRAYAHINAQGEWVQPVNKSEARTENRTEVVFSGKRSPVFSNGEEILIANDKLLENDATH